MGKDEANDYRGYRFERCDSRECGRWRLMVWDISNGESVESCNRPRFDTLREAREYIDMLHDEGERCGWQLERDALKEFDRALYRTGNRDAALCEAGDSNGFTPREMSLLLEERERPGSRARRLKPLWYPIASALAIRKGTDDRPFDSVGDTV